MPVSTRPLASPLALASAFALALALPLTLAAPGAFAGPLYAVAEPGGAGGLDGSGVIGSVLGGDTTAGAGAYAIDDVAAVGADSTGLVAPTGLDIGDAVRLDPGPPAPEPGIPGMLGFGLALVILRGPRPANLRFRAQ